MTQQGHAQPDEVSKQSHQAPIGLYFGTGRAQRDLIMG